MKDLEKKGRVLDFRDLETQVFDFATVQWYNTEKMSIGVCLLAPGSSHERESHDVDETFYILSGDGEVIFYYQDEERYPLAPGKIVHIPAGIDHGTRVTGWEPLKVLIIDVPVGPAKELMEAPGLTLLPPGKMPKYFFK